MEVNSTLRRLRKSRGLTQVELAREIGVGDQTVGAWERGRTAITLQDACKLADFYNCSLDTLVGRDTQLLETASNDVRYLHKCFDHMSDEHRTNVISLADSLYKIDALVQMLSKNNAMEDYKQILLDTPID